MHPFFRRSRQWYIDRGISGRIQACARDKRLHEVLWYCVPGVFAALVLRTALMAAMPFGYYHPDTHDFMATAFTFVTKHRWVVHGKTTFLTPLLYLLAFLPKVPALFVVPAAQHARGLLMVMMVGALARLWFRFWRWWILPLTVLAAMQPAVIFWEHALTSESAFVFCAVLLALAGTLFARKPDPLTYGLLLGSMCCVAAARPEGNLWQGTGVLLALIAYRGRWKQEWLKIVVALAVAVGMLSITKTTHSGLLLYSSLVHFTPDEPKAVPGFGPYIRPTRDRYNAQRTVRVSNDVVEASRPVQKALASYVADHPRTNLGLPPSKKNRRRKVDLETDPGDESGPGLDLRQGNNLSSICRRLAIEAAVHHLPELPGYAWRKFLARINEDPGGRFDDYPFHEQQALSLTGKPAIARVLGRGLTGTPLDTPEQARTFVAEHYDLKKVAWFNTLEAGWQAAVNRFHLPDQRFSPEYTLPGLTAFHLLGTLGMLVALVCPGPARRFQWAFVPTMAGAWFIVMLTAEVIPRHRFVWEPFWLLYAFLLLDGVIAGIGFLRGRNEARAAPLPGTVTAAV